MAKYALSKSSQKQLVSCNDPINDVVNFVLDFIDVGVVYGHRGKAIQDKLFADGASKLKYPKSKHNAYPSNAVDLIVYVKGIGYIDEKTSRKYRDYYAFLAGLIAGYCHKQGYSFRWGGDWDVDRNLDDQTFDDLMHFEITKL
ncbi:TPA: M15 family metallopeptidase [Vibrio parahaemolyticus]|nr:M15 family metallopeptidase [Vibrio parahaemolyticus]